MPVTSTESVGTPDRDVPPVLVPGLERYLGFLCSPRGHQPLRVEGNTLVSADGTERFDVSPAGIPLFARHFLSEAAKLQQHHYDGMVDKYVENLGYPHTQEYMAYLDRELGAMLPEGSLGTVAELCCGRGEAARLLGHRMDLCVGVDVSAGMLEVARSDLREDRYFFLQGDATMLPLRDGAFDSVVMLGGIHHVPDRVRLFSEISRILRPGGRLYFREPVDDFVLWRAIRKVIYRASSALDHTTERPLRRAETEAALQQGGMVLRDWRTFGFLGFCLFMNSDVLVFNRLFRFLPGIRPITRAACRLDAWTTSLRPLRHAGLQVIGVAQRAADADVPKKRGDA